MARPNRTAERRQQALPVLAKTFAESGYAATTTADLAAGCGLQEPQLYRLWPSKKAMFLAVIEYLYDVTIEQWQARLGAVEPGQAIEALLDYDGRKRGSSGLHRITFAGLSESRDPEVREALVRLHKRFHCFLVGLLSEREKGSGSPLSKKNIELAAWGLIGMGSLVNIARELDLFSSRTQRQLMNEIGGLIAGVDRRP